MKYRELLEQNLKAALPNKLSSFTKHDADLLATLKVGEEVLAEEPRLRDVLNLLTWSGTAPMGQALLCALLAVENPTELAGALALGVELRLLQKTPVGESYAIHRLVGEVRREETPLAGREAWITEICQRAGDWFQEHRDEYTKLLRFEAEIDHLRAWQEHALTDAPSHAPRLIWLHAYPPFQQGRFREALGMVERARGLLRKLGSTDRELEAHLLNDLAALQSSLGNYREGLKLHEEALLIRRDLFSEIHADTARSLSNLASSYGEMGNPKHALALGERTLAIYIELFGERNADVADSLGNIASYHSILGKPEIALKLDEQALTIRNELFGERHPDTARSLNHIARHHYFLGKQELALELAKQALAIRHELFGEYHPDVAISMEDVAYFSRHIDPASALNMTKQALNILAETNGKHHSHTLQTAGNLSAMLRDMGQRAEALAVLDEYLPGLSSDNPFYTQLRDQRRQLLAQPIKKGFRQPSARHGGQKKRR